MHSIASGDPHPVEVPATFCSMRLLAATRQWPRCLRRPAARACRPAPLALLAPCSARQPCRPCMGGARFIECASPMDRTARKPFGILMTLALPGCPRREPCASLGVVIRGSPCTLPFASAPRTDPSSHSSAISPHPSRVCPRALASSPVSPPGERPVRPAAAGSVTLGRAPAARSTSCTPSGSTACRACGCRCAAAPAKRSPAYATERIVGTPTRRLLAPWARVRGLCLACVRGRSRTPACMPARGQRAERAGHPALRPGRAYPPHTLQ